MNWALLADLIVAIHVLWVLVVVLSVPLILVGAWRGWRFVRNPWFRYTHLAMILIVVAESYMGVPCPLTVWEHQAREAAGLGGYEGSFVGRLLHDLIFFDLPEWVFTAVYSAFLVLVVACHVLIPPKKFSKD